MAFQAGGQRSAPRPVPGGRDDQAYVRDYAGYLEAVPFPSLVVDHRWDVVLTNAAFRSLFRGIGPHPTAMPDVNFLRFVLFHPDAGTVLGDREASWCLPMLAQFADAMELHGHDRSLQAVRRDIAQDPFMDAAYRQGLPHWVRAVGRGAVEHDGSVRPLTHPDPRWGRTECRIVVETPQTLRDMGCTRLTLALRENRRAPAARERVPRRAAHHLRVVTASE